MTSPAEFIRKYETTPFGLYDLRGKQFIILEDTPISGKSIREKKEHNDKWNKDVTYFYILIENGMFHKDLKMTENEMLALFLNMPKGIQNLQGSIFEVDSQNRYSIKYSGNAIQDVNGNPIGNSSNSAFNPQISHPQQPQDQKELFIRQLIEGMKFSAKMGMKIDIQTLSKIADNVSPGNAITLIEAAKHQGYITESSGIFLARD